MANKERIQKLIDYLKRSKRWSQSNCAIPLGVQHFGKLGSDTVDWGQLSTNFQNIFGVDYEFTSILFGTHIKQEALELLQSLLDN